MKTYLYVNAALYALFALWCTLRPQSTAASTGYVMLNNSGFSEYLVVYGGLQWGLVAIFYYLAAHPEYHRLGLLFALFFYVPIVAYRLVTVLRFRPVGGLTLAIGGLEFALLAAALVLWLARGRAPAL